MKKTTLILILVLTVLLGVAIYSFAVPRPEVPNTMNKDASSYMEAPDKVTSKLSKHDQYKLIVAGPVWAEKE